MKIFRRSFTSFGLGLGIFTLAGAGVSYWLTSEESAIRAILVRRLGVLKVRDQDIADFCRQYVKFRASYRSQLRVLGIFSPILKVGTLYQLAGMGSPVRRLEDNIVSNFLLSTDFFDNGENLGRQLRYRGFYDPYTRPCGRFVQRN